MTASTLVASMKEGSQATDIYGHLRALIMSGQLGVNERLPTVRQTAADLRVAPGTAAKAYRMLEQDGLVVSRTAAGTRVAESAALLSPSLITLVQELAAEAAASDADVHDIINLLRIAWPNSSAPGGSPVNVSS